MALLIAVPLHVPVDIVPTVVNDEEVTLLGNALPVNVPAAAATVTLALPSNATPLILTALFNLLVGVKCTYQPSPVVTTVLTPTALALYTKLPLSVLCHKSPTLREVGTVVP